MSLPAIDFLSEKTITGGCRIVDVHAALGQLVQLVVDGRLDLGDVVSYLIGLDDVEAALERLRHGQGARSVIVLDRSWRGWDSDAFAFAARSRRADWRGRGGRPAPTAVT